MVTSAENRTCKNCLNAYNSPHSIKVYCVNKEFQAQFQDIDTTVKPEETCGTWSPRRADQQRIIFNNPVQLELFK